MNMDLIKVDSTFMTNAAMKIVCYIRMVLSWTPQMGGWLVMVSQCFQHKQGYVAP